MKLLKPASALSMQFQSIRELHDELLEDKIKLDIPASNQDKMKVLPEQDRFRAFRLRLISI